MKPRLFATAVLAGALLPALVADARTPTGAAPDRDPAAAAGDWPWWRGPRHDGTADGRGVVTEWNTTKNVMWRAAVPGRGHSSPVVCGDRVVLTTADEQAQKQMILAFDRRTGRPLWTTTAHEGRFPKINAKNSHASATPACDGERVYTPFLHGDALSVTATDLDGKIVWQTRAGPFSSEHGYGSSPVLYKGVVIVNGDSLDGSFVAALDRRTGQVAWRTDRTSTGKHGNYATPVLAPAAGGLQLVLMGMNEVTGYDPDTGKKLWAVPGPAEVTACTPAVGGGLVFVSGGYPERELFAIRPGAEGTPAKVVWRTGRGVTYVPSPLYHDGRLYVVADNAIVTCFDAATGKEVGQGRVQGGFSASPVLVGDKLFVTNEAGTTYVLKAGPRFEQVAANDLGDGGMATPAVSRGQLLLRTNHALYCIGAPGGSR